METEDVTGWVARNPCDHQYATPYLIGNLAVAATNCTRACPITTYPDNSQVCHACPVVGCATCGGTEGCEDCLIFHLLSGRGGEAQCLFIYGGAFGATLLFCLCLVLCGLLRFCCLALTSSKSPGALREVLAHRRRAKVHDYTLPGNPFYKFDDTNVSRQNISGLAPALYFRHASFQALLSFFLVLLLLLGYYLPTFSKESFLPQLIPDGQLGLVQKIHAVAIYATCLFAALRWVWTQDRAARTDVEEEPHLRNYALAAEGFPKSARSPHEVKAFFESILGFELEGVSIAYDLGEDVEFVEDRISKTLEQADTHLGVYPSELANMNGHVGDSQDGYVLDCLVSSGCAFVVFSREEDREFCVRRFAEIGRQVRQGLHKLGPAEGGQESDDEESQALLATGPSRSQGSRGRAPGGLSSAVLFRGKFPIRVSEAPEPCGLIWRHFSVQGGLHITRVVIALFASLLLVLVLSAVMFAPAVLFELSYADLRSPNQVQLRLAVLEQGIVAASAAIGSRILAMALRRAVEAGGFIQQVNEDSVFAVCTYCAMLANSVAPLIIAAAVAYTESIAVTRKIATAWLFQVLWLTMLVTELAHCLLPAWSYWSAHFWVRQSRYITVREAAPVLTSEPFPLAARYVDLLHAITLVLVMIVCDSTSIYTIGAQCLMFLYSVYVYFIDKYMFLRLHRQTYYTSSKMDATVHYLLVIPMSIIACLPLQYIHFHERWYLNLVILATSALSYLMMVLISHNCNDPQRELSDIPYVEVASLAPYNYFNTNHAHVLRTLHFPSIVVPPIYPFAPGKEYLHGGQFADYDDSVRLQETLMLLAKSPLKGLDDVGNPQDLG